MTLQTELHDSFTQMLLRDIYLLMLVNANKLKMSPRYAVDV